MIDPDTLARAKSADLLALASRYVELKRVCVSHGGEYAGPCPVCRAGRDRFRVQPALGRWLCRKCTEGKWRDAIALQMLVANQRFAEAVATLAGNIVTSRTPARMLASAEAERPSGPPCPAWQARARAVIVEAEARLWSPAGARALAWLTGPERGLTADTLRRWRLGYIAEDRREAAEAWGFPAGEVSVYIPRGILIPCEVAGVVWGFKVRRPSGSPKYLPPRGVRPALFMADTLIGQTAAVITEGEFDSLLLWQEAGDITGVATLGSASNRLDVLAWGLYLVGIKTRLLAFDADAAGETGAAGLAWLGGARRLAVPQLRPGDKDLTDYHNHGGDLRALVAEALGMSDAEKWPPYTPNGLNGLNGTQGAVSAINAIKGETPRAEGHESAPAAPCRACGVVAWQQRPDGGYFCDVCHPPAEIATGRPRRGATGQPRAR